MVPATREMITEHSRYRQHLGLNARPSPNEDTPLVLPMGPTAASGGTQTCAPLTRAALQATVKNVFAEAQAGDAKMLKTYHDGAGRIYAIVRRRLLAHPATRFQLATANFSRG